MYFAVNYRRLQKNNKNITIFIIYNMIFFRKKVNKMMKFIKMWKTINMCKKDNRNIKEVTLNEINLKEYIVIDVRSRREFSEKHLENSINIPLLEIKNKINTVVNDKNRKILMCCEYGGRSAKAVNILNTLGYVNIYNLKGGLENI